MALGLVNFVPADAYHFCLNWLDKFSQPGDQLLVQRPALSLSTIDTFYIRKPCREKLPQLASCLSACRILNEKGDNQYFNAARVCEREVSTTFLEKEGPTQLIQLRHRKDFLWVVNSNCMRAAKEEFNVHKIIETCKYPLNPIYNKRCLSYHSFPFSLSSLLVQH